MDYNLRYPIGEFRIPAEYNTEVRRSYIADIQSLPHRLRQEVLHLTDEQLDTQYRPEGWTIRQVVHHLADSHMNGFIRLKNALTEKTPTIKPYLEHLWAELADGSKMAIQPSLIILEGVHERWSMLLKSLQDSDWEKSYIHPEKGREISLKESTGSYAWHCNHHLSHITSLKARKDWK
jgi:hypothetical protein